MSTKKCPYCSEEIKKNAIVCKHCKTNLKEKQEKTKKEQTKKAKKNKVTGCIIILIVLFFIFVGYLSSLDQQAQQSSKENALETKQKIENLKEYISQKEPIRESYIFDELLYNQQISVNLAEPASALNRIDARIIFSDKEELENYISREGFDEVNADEKVKVYEDKDDYSLIKFTNTKGTENIGWIDSRYVLDNKKYQTVSSEYYNSDAGKICKKHPDWFFLDCQKIADNKYWIGMTYDMLIELRGKPNSANPSNYGSGTKWQWCWNNHKPRCFYDNNGDMVIDSYN